MNSAPSVMNSITNLVTLSAPASATAEAYRTLRTNLHFASLERPLKTIVVASPDIAEAGSLALANLAVTVAQSGKQVVAVDADLRQPRLHTYFNMPNGPGFAEMLSNAVAQPAPQPTSIPNLRVLTSGTPPAIPSDVISSARMGSLIESLAGMADMVLFNTSPVAMSSDAAILASQVDGVLLVISAGRTHREYAQQSKDVLARAKANLLGAVMLNTR